MRALRTDGRTLQLSLDASEPALAPGEALVQPTRVLLTSIDARVTSSDRTGFTGTVGHLFTGIVRRIDLPKDAPSSIASRRALAGRRVVASPVISCGHCDLCRGGLPGHCRARQVLGVYGRDGACAELVSVPLVNLHALPEKLSDERAVFAPLVASALHTAHMLRAEGRRYVTLLGDSALALLTAQVLARQNKTVRVLTDSPEAARLCEQWAIKHRSPSEPGRRQDQDAVVDCTGAAAGLRLAMQMTRPRGLIMLKSPVADLPFPAGRPFPENSPGWAEGVDLTPAVANELQIIGSRDGPLPEAIIALADGAIDVDGLIGRRFRLEQGAAAMSASAAAGPLSILVDELSRSVAKAA